MSPDPHAPTPAGPDPDAAAGSEAAAEATERAASATPEPAADAPAAAPAEEPTAVVSPGEGTAARPAGSPAGGEWLKPGADEAASAPDPVISTPDSMTPLGTPDGGDAGASASPLERPEVKVGLAFVGGAVATFVLKRFGR